MYQPGKIHCYVSSSIMATRNMEFEIRRGGFSSSFFLFFFLIQNLNNGSKQGIKQSCPLTIQACLTLQLLTKQS